MFGVLSVVSQCEAAHGCFKTERYSVLIHELGYEEARRQFVLMRAQTPFPKKVGNDFNLVIRWLGEGSLILNSKISGHVLCGDPQTTYIFLTKSCEFMEVLLQEFHFAAQSSYCHTVLKQT